MIIKGIIFDFDGLICDTETPELHAWETLFSEYGQIFPFNKYQVTIGAIHNDETPFILLEEMAGISVDREKINQRFNDLRRTLIDLEPLRPGILDYLINAKNRGLAIGLASSSPRTWIDYHIDRLAIKEYFKCIKTFDDVSITKPDPELFLSTIDCLGLEPWEVIALEDSINGVSAAKKAGIYVVVIPNPVTRIFDFKDADLVLDSLEDIDLDQMLEGFNKL